MRDSLHLSEGVIVQLPGIPPISYCSSSNLGYNHRMFKFIIIVSGIITLPMVFPRDGFACAIAYSAQGQNVGAMTEKTVIIWDAEKKIEHFVRSIDFDIDGKSLGFIVPTPTVPVVKEADLSIFLSLNRLIDCKLDEKFSLRRLQHVIPREYSFSAASQTAAASAYSAGAEVVNRTQVAGMDVAVLKASDPAALNAWLTANDFETRPGLIEWAKYYVERKWVFTAFKYLRIEEKELAGDEGHLNAMRKLKGANHGRLPILETKTVRLSFAAEKAYYPYREPVDTELLQRELEVYVIAPTPVSVAGLPGGPNSSNFFRKLPSVEYDGPRAGFADTLPVNQLPKSLFITKFTDGMLKRPNLDVVFEPFVEAAVPEEIPGVKLDQYLGPMFQDALITNHSFKMLKPMHSIETVLLQPDYSFTKECAVDQKKTWCEVSVSGPERTNLTKANAFGAAFIRQALQGHKTLGSWEHIKPMLSDLDNLAPRIIAGYGNSKTMSKLEFCTNRLNEPAKTLDSCKAPDGGYRVSASKAKNSNIVRVSFMHQYLIPPPYSECRL